MDGELLARYLKNRRSVRVWKAQAVTKEDVQRLIDVAAYAPSACNIPPIKWVIAADPLKVQELATAVIAVLKSFRADHPMADVAKMLPA